MKSYTLLIGLLFIVYHGHSQSRDVVGTLLHDDMPISGITVKYILDNIQLETPYPSDEDGFFRIKNVPVGRKIKVIFQQEGFKRATIVHTVGNENANNYLGDIFLQKKKKILSKEKEKGTFDKLLLPIGAGLLTTAGVIEFAFSEPAYKDYKERTGLLSDYNKANKFRRAAIGLLSSGLVVGGIGLYKMLQEKEIIKKKPNKTGLNISPLIVPVDSSNKVAFGIQLTF